MRVIDTHCHPQYFVKKDNSCEPTQELIDAFLNECFSVVDSILMVALTLDDFNLLRTLARCDKRAHMSIGIHPCYVQEHDFKTAINSLHEYASDPLVRALGETGLDDYHSTEHSQLQEDFFAAHLECGVVTEKPIIVHTRSARKRTLEIIKAHKESRGVIHCFTEDIDFAREVLDLGWMISLSGIITFPKAQELRDVLDFIPMDSLLIETDAPYLAPVPFRGKTNHPSYVTHVADYIARFKRIDLKDFIEQIHHNYNHFLSINKR